MPSNSTLPSMLVFGPHNEFPPEAILEDLRQELNTNARLVVLRDAVSDLPRFWRKLLDFDPELRQVPGDSFLGQLKQWLRDGGCHPYHHGDAPNHYGLAVTVLLQISQYSRYLDHLGKNSHLQILRSVKTGAIQGFCAGFLCALAVASAATEADIGPAAAVALRLAVCIGAYVDQDGIYAEEHEDYSCVALRWKEIDSDSKAEVARIIELFPKAYISSVNDEACVTVTLRSADVDDLNERARIVGLRSKTVSVRGRFHTSEHSRAAAKLAQLVLQSEDLRLPEVDMLSAPLRSTVDGNVISEGSLVQHVLNNTLLKAVDWHQTLRSSVRQLGRDRKTAAFAGFGNHFPPSLALDSSFEIFTLSRLGAINVNGFPNGSHPRPEYPPHSIAVVGMAGRFPGADSVDELWELILEGKTTVGPAPVDRLNLSQAGDFANTKWWGNFIRDPDAFDHRFFKKSSREALAWDPQQRILLEVIYTALESAGYFGPASTKEPQDYGCYIGACISNYYDNVSCYAPTAYATMGTTRGFISGCMSHYFGWTGPSLTIDTACSSSLVAINTACRAIWSGECSRAVAGGTNVISSPFDYQNLSAAGFLSPTGQCKPFDSTADGYCRGEGVAVVVLKRLSDAIKDGDNVLGVISGSAANQNHNDSLITVPHSGSQSELYRDVLKLSRLRAESVSYVEAHGTGTGVGDPVEVRSIRDVFGGPQRDSVLHFASIKGNIGHTEGTAGVAGLIKVLLMMKHKLIPMQASHSTINPKIPPLGPDKMLIPRNVVSWDSPVRAACVNSYGAAGSNSALIVLEKPSFVTPTSLPDASRWPLIISAGSASSLATYSRKLLDWLQDGKAKTGDFLASLTFNLADRANHALPHTLAASVSKIEELASKLEAAASQSATGFSITESPKPVILVFGGQESDFIGLSEDIYHSSKVFRHHLDTCNNLFVSMGLDSFLPAIFHHKPIQNLVTLHSALFATQYASAKSWMDCGLNVSAVVGHSFGHLAALCISGVLSLPNAVTLVAGRAALMIKHWGDEPGSMIFLQADRQTVDQALQSLTGHNEGSYAEVACCNGPNSHVVVGSAKSISALEQHVASTPSLRDTVRTKKLQVTHGFHSKYTESMLPHLSDLAKTLTWRSPKIHLETCDEDESISEPDFGSVAEHTRRPVFFKQAIKRLSDRFSRSTWIEVGRGSSVIQLAKGSVPNVQGHGFLSPQLTASDAHGSLTNVTVDLWKTGYSVQYWPFHRSQKQEYAHLSLPPYQFGKTRHWLPFKGNRAEKKVEAVPEIKPAEAEKVLSFIRFDDSLQKEAVFRINPEAERFRVMLAGHVMAGQGLCPASLYYELVSRAAMFLETEAEVETHVPTVNDLTMKSPIGRDASVEIRLKLKRVDELRPSWQFSVTTRSSINPSAAPFEVTTGKVSLKRRDDAQTVSEFKRFESLTGSRRVEEVLRHPNAEKMQGKHIYRAFTSVVYYGPDFRGIKQIASVGMEAAGKVVITPNVDGPPDQRLCDTPMTDSFMQFAGFLVNYFHNPSLDDVLVCGKIEHIETGGSFNPDAGEWIVYANMTEGGETDMSADAYVFESESNKMVMAVFGLRFNKMPQASLARILRSVNRAAEPSATRSHEHLTATVDVPVTPNPAALNKKPFSKRLELFGLLSSITDVPLEEMKGGTTLDDLGIDSLMATEVLNNIRYVFGLTMDLTSFLFFADLGSLAAHVDEKLGLTGQDDASDAVPTPASWDMVSTRSSSPELTKSDEEIPKPGSTVTSSTSSTAAKSGPAVNEERPTITSAADAFQQVRLRYDQLAEGSKALEFWSQAYPHQARLVLAYVVEAFAKLGCDMRELSSGDDIPEVRGLEKHKRLIRQLFRVLEHGKLIFPSTDESFARTDTPVDAVDAESIYQQIINLHPQHTSVNKLVRIVGSKLAACLVGETDGIQTVFGNKEAKKILEDVYEFWPLFRTPTLVLGDFMTKAFTSATGSGKFKILEVGAGTGGTTRYIINHLKSHGIPFEYVFTDVSSSLVAAARQQFKGVEGMSFEVLDIEKTPEPEHDGAFHCVLATNTIHATRNLDVSLRNLRGMLRQDGALTLVEITRRVFWLDLVFGQFEGWWLFEDGRSHALIDEEQWESRMRAAGFNEVQWSDGACPESKTVRLIGAFPSKKVVKKTTSIKAALETVVYKRIGDLDIHADVYYPAAGELPRGKMPVALMIHGGSHIMFTRKDVRPPQTRLLLERGFVPVALDHRLCPEVSLSEGPMVDVCDALEWARNKLPSIQLKRAGLQIDGQRVVVVGWSSGGQLAMSTAWTAPQRGLRPPEAILSFYCPTNYEDEWWRNPIQPVGAEDTGVEYDVLEAVQDKPITNYGLVGAWEPLSDPRILTDARCRIVLHINWKAQTLPIITGGLPSRKEANKSPDKINWHALPQPSLETIRAVSPLAQVRAGNYKTPTFLIHGTADDLIPWQQSQGTYEAMVEKGIPVELALVEGAPHITDLSSNPSSKGWQAAIKGYDFICSYVFP